MTKTLLKILRTLTVRILARYEPIVVAVTGSVGKTSTSKAITAVLKRSFDVRQSPKNFNNEIGVPLTIIGAERSGGKSPFTWASILWRGLAYAYGAKKSYPKVLVLEMGADHPGDLAYLTEMARPDIAVVTAVSAAHTEFFKDIDGVAQEKGTLVEALPEGGVAVLNGDDPRVRGMAERTKAKKVWYGFSDEQVRAENVHFESAMGTYFTRFDLKVGQEGLVVTLAESVGPGNIYAALAAAAVGRSLGVTPELLSCGLAEYQPPPGRLRVIRGIKNTTILDLSLIHI